MNWEILEKANLLRDRIRDLEAHKEDVEMRIENMEKDKPRKMQVLFGTDTMCSIELLNQFIPDNFLKTYLASIDTTLVNLNRQFADLKTD